MYYSSEMQNLKDFHNFKMLLITLNKKLLQTLKYAPYLKTVWSQYTKMLICGG
jgi:hypothetical protein